MQEAPARKGHAMRAREVISRGSKKFRVKFPSKKLNRGVHCESLLERDFLYLLEFSPGVISYKEQPEKIFYERHGKTHAYFPDFEVRLRNGKVLYVEIKPLRVINTVRNLSKFEAIINHFELQKRDFRIFTDHRIRKQPLLGNLEGLYKFLRSARDISADRLKIFDLLATRKTYTLGSLANVVGVIPVNIMLAHHELICDLNKNFWASDNYVWLVKEDHRDSVLF